MLKRLPVPRVSVQSHEALGRLWSDVQEPWLQSESRLRCVLFDSNKIPKPHTIEIDVASSPDPDRLALLLDVLSDMIADVVPGGSVAIQYFSVHASFEHGQTIQWTELIANELCQRVMGAWPVFVSNGAALWGIKEIPAELVS